VISFLEEAKESVLARTKLIVAPARD
jgi:hypothetical protein